MPVEVRQVANRAEKNIFVKFPWKLYASDPNWVPPLVSSQRRKLDQRRNPTWRYMEGAYFIAWRGTQPVGTIAAFINHRHNDYHNERIGFFGCFELVNDQAVANALLESAAHYLAARGCHALRGPANFSINDEFGMLVDGFDDVPVSVMPYNPPYYVNLLEGAPEFEQVMNLYSYYLTLQTSLRTEKLNQTMRLTERNNARRGITVRTLATDNLEHDLEIIKHIYNTAWDNNWGFVPMTARELDEMIDAIRHYMEPRLAFVAEVHGAPAGFLLAFPDLNQALHFAHAHPGKPDMVSQLQFLWHWKMRSKISRLRIPIMGVEADYRGIGVEAALFRRLFEEATYLGPHQGWEYADAGWVLQTNVPMRRLVTRYGGTAYRRYSLYERKLIPHSSPHFAPAHNTLNRVRQRSFVKRKKHYA